MGRLLRPARRLAGAARWEIAGTAGELIFLAALIPVVVYLPQLVIDPRGLSRNDWLTHVGNLRGTVLQAWAAWPSSAPSTSAPTPSASVGAGS